ncbi:MAG: hypothetical protein Q8R91_01930 [Candidatus Omnitrophota bacterium]|nr:hypothetical protein [Candidatus Omnitrophota bacterium]
MSLPRWLTLIAVLVGVGCLQVAVRNAVILRGYAVGERLQRLHRQEGDLSWLTTKVAGLSSPASLARVAREHHPNLVAWRTLPEPSAASVVSPASLGRRDQLARAGDHDASDE